MSPSGPPCFIQEAILFIHFRPLPVLSLKGGAHHGTWLPPHTSPDVHIPAGFCAAPQSVWQSAPWDNPGPEPSPYVCWIHAACAKQDLTQREKPHSSCCSQSVRSFAHPG